MIQRVKLPLAVHQVELAALPGAASQAIPAQRMRPVPEPALKALEFQALARPLRLARQVVQPAQEWTAVPAQGWMAVPVRLAA